MKRFRALLRLKLDLIRVFSFKFGMLLGFFYLFNFGVYYVEIWIF
jgi:hypothetical protein